MQKRLQDVTALGRGPGPLLCRGGAQPAWRRLCAPGSPPGLLASCAAVNPRENAWPSFSPGTERAAPALFLVESVGSQGEQVLSLVEGSEWHGQPPGALGQGLIFSPQLWHEEGACSLPGCPSLAATLGGREPLPRVEEEKLFSSHWS